MLRSMLVVACAVLLAGCASKRCLSDQPYAHAESVPALKPVEGVKLPEAAAALKIPPPPANPVPFGEKVKDAKGEEVVQCLDRPPPMHMDVQVPQAQDAQERPMPKPAEEPPAPETKPVEPAPAS